MTRVRLQPKPFDREAHARKLARTPGASWRFQTGGSLELRPRGGMSRSERFDEVVVDDWLHAEMMDNRSCFVSVAGLCLWLHLTKDGAVITHAEARGVPERSLEVLRSAIKPSSDAELRNKVSRARNTGKLGAR